MPPPTSKPSLIDWATKLLIKEVDAQTYGTITIHLERGRITRASIERSEMPQRENTPEK